jgi:hypothetical protein
MNQDRSMADSAHVGVLNLNRLSIGPTREAQREVRKDRQNLPSPEAQRQSSILLTDSKVAWVGLSPNKTLGQGCHFVICWQLRQSKEP